MSLIIWDNSYLLGVQEFDDHHKHLVELLNKIYDDFTTGAPEETVGAVLDELIDYAIYHFAAEEYWMRDQAYPALGEHVQEHDRFSKRVVEMQKDFRNGKVNLSLELLAFLKNWLTSHILETDAQYARYKRSSGIDLQLD